MKCSLTLPGREKQNAIGWILCIISATVSSFVAVTLGSSPCLNSLAILLLLEFSVFKVLTFVLHMLNKIILSDFRVQVLFTTFVQIHHEGAEWEDSITISKENFLIPVLPLSSFLLWTSILHLYLYFQRPPLFHQITCMRSTIVAGVYSFSVT